NFAETFAGVSSALHHPRHLKMEVDIMNQEESKLKPLTSELDSSLISAVATGRDQSSSSTTLRHRHHLPFDPLFSQQRYSILDVPFPEHLLLISTLTDTHSSMNPAQVQVPPLAAPFMPSRKESVLSPEDLSAGPSRSPVLTYHGNRQTSQSLYNVQEEDSYEDGDDQDPGNDTTGMELDDNGLMKPQVDIPGPSTAGDVPKGAQRNFVYKLFQMLEDPAAKAYIQWSQDGREFIVTNQDEFAPQILSKHFKHSNFSSFVRQLNMYDFHKTNRAPRSQRGTAQHQLWIFSHHKFVRGRPDLLQGIKRKANETNVPIQYGEDQLQAERRPSLVAGLRSPPNGPIMSQDALITELQKQNEELHQRLLRMELGYRRLETKLDSVMKALQPQGQQQLSLDPREPIGRSPIAPLLQQHTSQGEHVFDYGVPSSLGAVGFQQASGDSISSPSTESQSSINQYRSTETPNTFSSIPPSTGPPHMQVSANNTTAIHATSVPAQGGLTQSMTGGASPYPVHHQSAPVSQYTFQGIASSLNTLNPGTQQLAGYQGENYFAVPTSAPSRTIAQSQNRMHLGGRANPVMMTPAPLKAQPPDSIGGLRR
ncbi:hypothetical protein FRC01_002699, partial [Tulasnella sp. 417]